MKDEAPRHSYTFYAFGHPNIKANHFKTLEFTKDEDLTERGDCIIGIKANFEIEELKKFKKKVKLICEVEDDAGRIITSEFKFTINPNFNSEHELVIRKSGFDSDRTYGFNLNKGSNRLDREIVELLKDPGRKMKVTLVEGWR